MTLIRSELLLLFKYSRCGQQPPWSHCSSLTWSRHAELKKTFIMGSTDMLNCWFSTHGPSLKLMQILRLDSSFFFKTHSVSYTPQQSSSLCFCSLTSLESCDGNVGTISECTACGAGLVPLNWKPSWILSSVKQCQITCLHDQPVTGRIKNLKVTATVTLQINFFIILDIYNVLNYLLMITWWWWGHFKMLQILNSFNHLIMIIIYAFCSVIQPWSEGQLSAAPSVQMLSLKGFTVTCTSTVNCFQQLAAIRISDFSDSTRKVV